MSLKAVKPHLFRRIVGNRRLLPKNANLFRNHFCLKYKVSHYIWLSLKSWDNTPIYGQFTGGIKNEVTAVTNSFLKIKETFAPYLADL